MSKFHIRTIRNGRIKLFGKYWKPKWDVDISDLNGVEMVFGDYRPGEPNLLNLWGIPALFYYNDDDDIQKLLWVKQCKMLGGEPIIENPSLRVPSGIYMMNRLPDDKYEQYPSRGIEFWVPVPQPGRGEERSE